MGSVSATPPSKRLDGKVAIITGGANGIGASAVHVFWENGAKVVIADIQDEAGQAIANKLGENVTFVHCDVLNEDEVRNLVDTTVEKHGKLDIMYNNASVMDRIFGSILDIEKSDLVGVINVNLVGAFLGAKHAARVMIPKKKGCILFTSSACTSIAGLFTHSYTISKHGIYGLVKNLAAELGQHGIRVNCVSPYAVICNTGQELSEDGVAKLEETVSEIGNLKGKILKADDIARATLYLASDEASYVSGHDLVVDGGFSVVNPSLMNAYEVMIDSVGIKSIMSKTI